MHFNKGQDGTWRSRRNSRRFDRDQGGIDWDRSLAATMPRKRQPRKTVPKFKRNKRMIYPSGIIWMVEGQQLISLTPFKPFLTLGVSISLVGNPPHCYAQAQLPGQEATTLLFDTPLRIGRHLIRLYRTIEQAAASLSKPPQVDPTSNE